MKATVRLKDPNGYVSGWEVWSTDAATGLNTIVFLPESLTRKIQKIIDTSVMPLNYSSSQFDIVVTKIGEGRDARFDFEIVKEIKERRLVRFGVYSEYVKGEFTCNSCGAKTKTGIEMQHKLDCYYLKPDGKKAMSEYLRRVA